MSITAPFTFHGRQEALEIVNTSGDLVGYLATQSAECPLIGADIQLIRKLGEGEFGAAFLIQIRGMGPKEYVAKITKVQGVIIERSNDENLGQFAKRKEERSLVSAKTIIALNGGDPQRIIQAYEDVYVPVYAHICKSRNSRSYHRFDKKGSITIPAGSYLCEDEQYSEYVIGVLCGDLYRRGISANFLDVFGFASCPNKKKIFGKTEERFGAQQYVFMEKADCDFQRIEECARREGITFSEDQLKNTFPIVLLIQILHAVATYQRYYQLQHNDLHGGNIFIEFTRPGTMFNGQTLHDATWFHYHISGVDLYLPAIPMIVKIGDFGLSVKFSRPIVGSKTSIETGFEQDPAEGPWIPNWYAPNYDALFIAYEIYTNNWQNSFLRRLMGWMLGIRDPTPESIYVSNMENYLAGEGSRPKMSSLSKLPNAIPENILQNRDLMRDFLVQPTSGKIVTLGVIE